MLAVPRAMSGSTTNGSEPVAPAYHRLVNPSASASAAWSIIRSTVAPSPLIPMRMVTRDNLGRRSRRAGGAERGQAPGPDDRHAADAHGQGADDLQRRGDDREPPPRVDL